LQQGYLADFSEDGQRGVFCVVLGSEGKGTEEGQGLSLCAQGPKVGSMLSHAASQMQMENQGLQDCNLG